MTYIPPIKDNYIMLETHIVNFSGNIYGEIINVELIEKIRNHKNISSIYDIKKQIDFDYKNIKNMIELYR